MAELPEFDAAGDGAGRGTDAGDVAEVKTLTFATLRAFLPDHFGEDAYQNIRAGLPADTLALLDQAEAGEWAAEGHMHAVMRCIYDDLVARDDDVFLAFARALAAAGIGRFMKIFLSLASERFVLRKVPVVWNRLRRNAGHVAATVTPETVRLQYEGFPYFGDHVYRLLSLANCQALVYAATKQLPSGRIVQWSEDSLVLEFDLQAAT